LTYLIGEVYVTPTSSAIIPPFTSKVGKTLIMNNNVTISPLKKGGSYLVKYSPLPYYMEVEGGDVYSFEVGGRYEDVIVALTQLENKVVFNTEWKIVDVKLNPVNFNCDRKFTVEILTPALIIDPIIKSKKKRFTNLFSFAFAVNFMDHFKLNREEYKEMITEIEEKVREEPSKMRYATVIYAGKEVVGMLGTLRYELLKRDESIFRVIENAIAKGIGSSRKNGFGRIKITCGEE